MQRYLTPISLNAFLPACLPFLFFSTGSHSISHQDRCITSLCERSRENRNKTKFYSAVDPRSAHRQLHLVFMLMLQMTCQPSGASLYTFLPSFPSSFLTCSIPSLLPSFPYSLLLYFLPTPPSSVPSFLPTFFLMSSFSSFLSSFLPLYLP